jgi:hydrogenase nickel incorporation protein HypB
MCGTCGCGEPDVSVDGRHSGGSVTLHAHDHEPHGVEVEIETALLAKNDHLAAHNREWLAGQGIVALNLMSSPGSGKTSLLRRTIPELAPERPVGVIEGDQETRLDADREHDRRAVGDGRARDVARGRVGAGRPDHALPGLADHQGDEVLGGP